MGGWGRPSREGTSLPGAGGGGGGVAELDQGLPLGPPSPQRGHGQPGRGRGLHPAAGSARALPYSALPTLRGLAGKHPAQTLGFWLKGDKRSAGTGGHCEGAVPLRPGGGRVLDGPRAGGSPGGWLLPGFLASQPLESQRRLLNGDSSLAGRGHPLRPRRVNLAEACPLAQALGVWTCWGRRPAPMWAWSRAHPSSGTWPPFPCSSLMAASGSRGPRPPG